MTAEKKIKKYRAISIFIFIVLVAVLLFYAKSDIVNIDAKKSYIEKLDFQDMTIEQLNQKVYYLSDKLEQKTNEVELLKENITSLKKVLNEKKIKYNISVIDSMPISTGSNGEIIKIGE